MAKSSVCTSSDLNLTVTEQSVKLKCIYTISIYLLLCKTTEILKQNQLELLNTGTLKMENWKKLKTFEIWAYKGGSKIS